MNGTIPTEILKLVQLGTSCFVVPVAVDPNKIDGVVLFSLVNAEVLDVRNTSLTGSLPVGLCDELLFLDVFEVDCDSSIAKKCSCCGCLP